MPLDQKYPIIQQFLTTPSSRRSGDLLTKNPIFVVAHDTGNPGSTALQNVRYYQNSCNDAHASAHLFVDDQQIIECIPALTTDAPEKAWHVIYNVDSDDKLFGANANDAAIGIEYCYGGTINADEAYVRYVWTIAYTCAKFDIDPNTHVIGHHFLDPLRKTDPVTGLLQSRRSYEQLLQDVVAEHREIIGAPKEVDQNFFDETGQVTVAVRLNIRSGLPCTKSPVVKTANPADVLDYIGWQLNGENVNGNPRWFKTADGNWFWSGGVLPAK